MWQDANMTSTDKGVMSCAIISVMLYVTLAVIMVYV